MIGSTLPSFHIAPWFSKLLVTALAAFAAVRYGFGLYAWKAANSLEKPAYTIIRRLTNNVELRRYEPYLIAEASIDKEGFREPARDGFQTCAGYIFGKNKRRNLAAGSDSEKMAMTASVRVSGRTKSAAASEKMAMTSPVRIAGGGRSQKTKVSFVIGSKYNLKSAPLPLDKNVKVREVKGHVLAARTFSGPPPQDDQVQEERLKIEQALQSENIQISKKDGEETLVYGYHDPVITPRWLRKNEVAVMVDPSSITS